MPNTTYKASAVLDVTQFVSKIKEIQNQLNNIKIPKSFQDSMSSSFSSLEKNISKFQKKIEEGVSSKTDAAGISKLANTIVSDFNNIQKSYQKMSGMDFDKLFKIDPNTTKEIANLDRQISAITKSFNTDFASKIQSGLEKLDELKGLSSITKSAQTKVSDITTAIKNQDIDTAIEKINQLISAETRYRDKTKDNPNEKTAYHTSMINGLNKVSEALKTATADGEKFNQSIEIKNAEKVAVLAKSFENAKKSFSDLGPQINNVGNSLQNNLHEISSTAEATADMNREFDITKQRITALFGADKTFELLRRSITQAFEKTKELDKSITDIAVVTDFTSSDLWNRVGEYTQLANKLGATIQGAYETSKLYYQQGLKTNEVMTASEETMKMARIASLDYAQATDFMTAALKGFNISAAEAARINDVYSQLAAKSASDTKEIASAMTKTASIANNAGMSFEFTSALLTKGIETTREAAENLGTALKTVIARFVELKKAPSEIGEVEGETVDANRIETALKSVGISLRGANQEFRSLEDVISELGGKWDGLTLMQQRYVATQAAGSRQQSRFIAMLDNWGRTQELINDAQNSAGASQVQFNKTLDSLEAKLNKLSTAWTEFITGIANSALIKSTVDLLTNLITAANKMTSSSNSLADSLGKLALAFGLIKGAGFVVNKIFAGITKLVVKNGDEAGAGYANSLISTLNLSLSKGKINLSSILDLAKGKKDLSSGIKESQNYISEIEKIAKIKKENADFQYYTGGTTSSAPLEDSSFYQELDRAEVLKKISEDSVKNQGSAIKQLILYNSGLAKSLNSVNLVRIQGNKEIDRYIGYLTTEQAETLLSAVATGNETVATEMLNIAKTQEQAIMRKSIIYRIGEYAEKIKAIIANKGEAISIKSVVSTLYEEIIARKLLNSTYKAGLALIGKVALVAAGIVLVGALIVGIIKEIQANSLEGQINATTKAIDGAKKSVEDAKAEFDNLRNSLNQYDDAVKGMGELREGTEDWKNSIIDLNSQVIQLLSNYDGLIAKKGSSGFLEITSESREQVQKGYQQSINNANASLMGSLVNQQELKQKQLQDNLFKSVGISPSLGINYAPEKLKSDLLKATQASIDGDFETYNKFVKILESSGLEAEKVSKAIGNYIKDWQLASEQINSNEKNFVSAMASDEMISDKNGQLIIDAYNFKAEQLNDIDENISKLFEDSELAIIQRGSGGQALNLLREKYAELLSITVDEIPEDIKGSIPQLKKALSNIQIGKEISSNLEESFNIIKDLDLSKKLDKQKIYDQLFGKDLLLDPNADDILGYDSKDELISSLKTKMSDLFGGEDQVNAFIKTTGYSIDKFYNFLYSKYDEKNEEFEKAINFGNYKGLENLGKQLGVLSDNSNNLTSISNFIKELAIIKGVDKAKEFADFILSISNSLGYTGEKAKEFNEILLNIPWDSSKGALAYANDLLESGEITESAFDLILEKVKEFANDLKDININKMTGENKSLKEIQKKLIESSKTGEIAKLSKEEIQTLIDAGTATRNDFRMDQFGDYTLKNNTNAMISAIDSTIAGNIVEMAGTTNQILSFLQSRSIADDPELNRLAQDVVGEEVKNLTDEEKGSQYSDAAAVVQGLMSQGLMPQRDIYGSYSDVAGAYGTEDYDITMNATEILKSFINEIGSVANLIANQRDLSDMATSQRAEGLAEAGYTRPQDYSKENLDSAILARQRQGFTYNEEDFFKNTGEQVFDENSLKQLEEFQKLLQEISNTASASNLKDWFNNLNKGYEALKNSVIGSTEYDDALVKLGNSLGFVGNEAKEFAGNNLGLIDSALKGNEKSFNKLNKIVSSNKIEKSLKNMFDTKQLKDFSKKISETTKNVKGLESLSGDEITLEGQFNALAELDDEQFLKAVTGMLYYMAQVDESIAENLAAALGLEIEWIPMEQAATEGYNLTFLPTPSGPPKTITGENSTKTNAMFPVVKKAGTQNVKNSIPSKSGGGSGGKGASQKEEPWENPYDKEYNALQRIELLTRRREKLEENINKLLTAPEVFKSLEAQNEIIKETLAEYSKLANRRQDEAREFLKSQSSMSKYGTYNIEKDLITINWDLINSVKSQDKGEEIEEYISKLEELQENYREAIDGVDEANNLLEELLEQGKDTYFSLEDKIYDAIVEREQQIVDELNGLNDTITEANERLINSITDSIEKDRQLRENQRTESDITEKQNRLSLLQRDTSGMYAKEIQALEKEISDMQEDYTDTLVDQAIDELKNQYDLASEQRDRDIEMLQNQVDWREENGYYWEEALKLLSGSYDKTDETVSNLEEFLKMYDPEYSALSPEQQKNFLKEFDKMFADGLAWFWEQSENQQIDITIKTESGAVTEEVGKSNSGSKTVNVKDTTTTTTDKTLYNPDGSIAGVVSDIQTTSKDREVDNPYYSAPTSGGRNGSSSSKSGSSSGGYVVYNPDGSTSTYKYASAAAKATGVSSSTLSNLKKGSILDTSKGSSLSAIKRYKSGGSADFTGPAWLDGTKSKPEIVLDQNDSKTFIQLRDTLRDLDSISNLSEKNSTLINIDINVESISNELDLDYMAERVGEVICDKAGYRNVIMLNNNR
jgi:TP901 family phage tail tape measure protein